MVPADRGALWELARRWVRGPTGAAGATGPGAAAGFGELIDDYRHWQLYQLSRKGDEAAAEGFERHWRQRVRVFFARRFPPDQLDELTALFFERVYRLVGSSFHWRCPFVVYLEKVLVNLSRDFARRIGVSRAREVSLEEGRQDGEGLSIGDRLPAGELSPEERLLRKETKGCLDRALLELSPGDRHIIRVCMVDGGSGQELAQRLGISRDALYQRLRRAKLRLRKCLGAQDVSDRRGGAV